MTEKPASPTPAQIVQARVKARLTQAEAAALVDVTRQRWNYWENGHFKMRASLWRLFLIETMTEPY